jgi:hypothetical protein
MFCTSEMAEHHVFPLRLRSAGFDGSPVKRHFSVSCSRLTAQQKHANGLLYLPAFLRRLLQLASFSLVESASAFMYRQKKHAIVCWA